MAAIEPGGDIYTSLDSGVTWTDQPTLGMRNWSSIAYSGDGNTLVAAVYGGDIYTSSDSGATWIDQRAAGTRNWIALSVSDDGSHIAAADFDGDLYTSSDAGTTWNDASSLGAQNWAALVSSSDGNKLAAAVSGGNVYTSTNGGTTWTDQSSAGQGNWSALASSADGTTLAATRASDDIYLSTDGGATWTAQSLGSYAWTGIASSGDGSKLVALANGGDIFTIDFSAPTDAVPPVITPPGAQTFEATGSLTMPVLVAATATDNLDPDPSITYTPHSFALGTTTVTWMATDQSGNGAATTSTVTILDTTPPRFSSVSDLDVVSDSGSDSAVTYTVPTASDLVDGSVAVSCTPTSGSSFALGTTNVSCSASDAAGNATSTQFSVTVRIANASSAIDLSSRVATTSSSASVTTASEERASFTVAGSDVSLTIPANTTISAPANWSGVIGFAEVATNSVMQPATPPNMQLSVARAIQIGDPTLSIALSAPARIVFAGAANWQVGYSRSSGFTPISAMCSSDNQAAVTSQFGAAASSDCYLNVGSDLVVWTNHFTSFVVYSLSPYVAPAVPAPVPGAGGGIVAGLIDSSHIASIGLSSASSSTSTQVQAFSTSPAPAATSSASSTKPAPAPVRPKPIIRPTQSAAHATSTAAATSTALSQTAAAASAQTGNTSQHPQSLLTRVMLWIQNIFRWPRI
jgi:hypothetical protein